MTLMIEREIKLRFDSPEEARAAILAAGATPLRCRRLQEDALLDTDDESLRRRGCVLRIRTESGQEPADVQGSGAAGPMKIREEHETVIGDGEVLTRVLEELGLHVWFRYEKFREEFAAEDVDDRDRRNAGRHVRRDRRRRGSHPERMARALGRGAGRFHPRLVSRPVPAASTRAARAARRRHGVRATNDPGARPDGRSGHAPSSALVRSRQGGAAGRGRSRSSQRILRWLAAAGVTDAVLNLHHLPHTLTTTRRRRQSTSACASATRGKSPVLGSAGGPRARSRSSARRPFLIVNGDTLTDVDVSARWSRTIVDRARSSRWRSCRTRSATKYGGVQRGR